MPEQVKLQFSSFLFTLSEDAVMFALPVHLIATMGFRQKFAPNPGFVVNARSPLGVLGQGESQGMTFPHVLSWEGR